MGKDKNGNFIPPKGKPSGPGNDKAGLKTVVDLEKLDEHEELADKYTDGADEPGENVPVRHKNRNTGKTGTSSPPYS